MLGRLNKYTLSTLRYAYILVGQPEVSVRPWKYRSQWHDVLKTFMGFLYPFETRTLSLRKKYSYKMRQICVLRTIFGPNNNIY
jgi:hypothetical protein